MISDRRPDTISAALFAEACALMPGGVSSPARAFRSVGGTPPFIKSGAGAHLVDEDGNRYVDYVLSFGPLILGHAHPDVLRAIAETAAHGVSFGAPSRLESELAREIMLSMPAVEMLRFVNSGTEAVMSAVRLARAFTGRELLVKFEGHYHGHADSLLARADAQTLTLPYNDVQALERAFHAHGARVAAAVVEPVAGNMGVVLPAEHFLQRLRALTEQHGALLVLDEVMTGFRVHPGSAQALYGITPDLTTLGKVIGGGLPVGAYGGRVEIMSRVAPQGDVYQAGTMSGNPLTMAAGLATLRELRRPGVWEGIARTTTQLAQGLHRAARERGVPLQVPVLGTMLSAYFSAQPVTDWTSAAASDVARFRRFFHEMLARGVYLPPSPFEAWFVSAAHGDAEVGATVEAAREALGAV